VYVTGGTVQAGGIYVRRAADDQLFAACRRGGLAYVLNSRQVGKSSLMIHAAERLLEEGGRVAIIDFTTLGANLTADEWYRGIVRAVAEQLELELEGGAWWDSQAGLGGTERFARFFREALERLPGQRVTIFFDEIDTTLALPFRGRATDDFFAAIRGLHLERAQDPGMARLGIVLIGAATPSDLIENPDRTPFNLGADRNCRFYGGGGGRAAAGKRHPAGGGAGRFGGGDRVDRRPSVPNAAGVSIAAEPPA
jgi:AAA-like domain